MNLYGLRIVILIGALMFCLGIFFGSQFKFKQESQTTNQLRTLCGFDPGLYLGDGELSPQIMNLGDNIHEAQVMFHRQMTDVTYNCTEIKRFGNVVLDGGYELCLDEHFIPKKDDCLIYSFGVNHDFSFEDAVHDEFNCEIHSFDPSMGLDDHIHREPNMFFHNLGLSGSDKVVKSWYLKPRSGKVAKSWSIKSIGTIVRMLNHENRIIDVLKADIEKEEWSFMVDLLRSGIFRQVRQLVMEPHSVLNGSQAHSLIDYAEMYNDIHSLDQVGFRRFLFNTKNFCCGKYYGVLMPRDIANTKKMLCCYEQFFVNMNLYM